jgi:hypothetical protein
MLKQMHITELKEENCIKKLPFFVVPPLDFFFVNLSDLTLIFSTISYYTKRNN